MEEIINKQIVLVLNKNWQAVGTKTPCQAFPMLATDVATGLDIDGENHMVPVRWDEWMKLPVRDCDFRVKTAKGCIRIPTVIVLSNFAKVPKTRPRFSLRSIWSRDGGRCQYTGRKLARGEGNIDHVLPRSRGGSTSWDNCVLADKFVNAKKANYLPEEVGLKLLQKPLPPREVPVTLMIKNSHGIKEWEKFLIKPKSA